MMRRHFLKTCGLGAVGLTALGRGPQTLRAATGVTPRGSAENLILIFLDGGASHVDTFDLKLGSWTPGDFEPGNFGNIELAGALFPKLSQQTDKFSLMRALNGSEQVHQRASYIVETCHTYNPVFAREQPHIGSLIAQELASGRAGNDILPTFLSINGRVQGPGMLAGAYAPFTFSSQDGVIGLEHPEGETLFRKRYESLMRFDGVNRTNAVMGNAVNDYHDFFQLGQQMMYQADAEDAFTLSDEESLKYGASNTGDACSLAVKALAKNRGTRVVQISMGGWDSHYDIYDRTVGGNIYDLSNELDGAVAAMLEDLAATPGKRGGTLLDETMVVVTGEFGRTPGPVTNNLGRDHYAYAWSALVAGGGIRHGQVFGATDEEGYNITDPFWSQNRFITMYDLIATIYSSLGIDWTKEISDTPSGRAYEYTPKVNGDAAYYKDIVEMFT